MNLLENPLPEKDPFDNKDYSRGFFAGLKAGVATCVVLATIISLWITSAP